MFLERGAESGVRTKASKRKLLTRDFVDSVLVTAAFELLSEPCVSDLEHSLEWDEASRHYKNICIVMLLDEFADFS